MSKEKECLLCNTENVKYDAEFVEKRTHFSAPKLRELRIKWNEAISKIHPILKTYVNNVDTYKVCDLHFRETDIKKNFETNGNVFRLPISEWGLKIEALPLSSKELGRKEPQKTNTNLSVEKVIKNTENRKDDNLRNESRKDNLEGNQSAKSRVNTEGNSKENIQVDKVQESIPGKNNEGKRVEETKEDPVTQKRQETESKETQPKKDKAPEKEKSTLIKNRLIRPNFRKKVEVKFSPYPVMQSFQQGVPTKAPQMIQIKSGKKQVFVVPPGAQVIPFSPKSSMSSISSPDMPLSKANESSPAMKIPIITHVTSLNRGSPITKFFPVTTAGSKPKIPHPITPVTKLPSSSRVPLVNTIPSVTKVSPSNSVAKMTPVSGTTKVGSVSGVTKVSSLSDFLEVPATYGVTKVSSAGKVILSPSNKTMQKDESPCLPPVTIVRENYDEEQLLCDLKRYPLPIGWAYALASGDKILFTQYCTNRRFPIFLRLEGDMTAMASVGHSATNFIPYHLKLECYEDVMRGLRKLENDKWCIGIGFNNNNHSDLCSVLAGRMNSRCKACATIRRNEQRNETEEIQRRQRQKPSKNLQNLVKNMKRINGRLEAKVCKMKLMVAHLKNKQCVDCLHDKFMKKTLAQTDSATNTASRSD